MTVSLVSVPGEGPSRVNAPEDYDQQTADYRAAFNTTVQEFNVAVGEFNLDAANINAQAAQVLAAQSAVFNAINAPVWVSGGSYTAVSSIVISPLDLLAYRARTTHSGLTDDPAADATNWKLAVGEGYAPSQDPVFTGDPQVPTPALGNRSASAASTEYVQAELDEYQQRPVSKALITTNTASVIFDLSEYSAYRLIMKNVNPVAASALHFFFGDGLSSFYVNNVYRYQLRNNNSFTNSTSLGPFIRLNGSVDANQTLGGFNLALDIYSAAAGDRSAFVAGRGVALGEMHELAGTLAATNLVASSCRINFQSQDIARGEFYLFAMSG